MTLCDSMVCSPPGSSVPGILQARILEWVVFSSPGNHQDPGIKPGSLALQVDSLPSEPPKKPWCVWIKVWVKWSRSVVSYSLHPMDCSLPCSSVHGILQARVLEWVATSFSKGSSQPRDWIWVSHIVGRRFMVRDYYWLKEVFLFN